MKTSFLLNRQLFKKTPRSNVLILCAWKVLSVPTACPLIYDNEWQASGRRPPYQPPASTANPQTNKQINTTSHHCQSKQIDTKKLNRSLPCSAENGLSNPFVTNCEKNVDIQWKQFNPENCVRWPKNKEWHWTAFAIFAMCGAEQLCFVKKI